MNLPLMIAYIREQRSVVIATSGAEGEPQAAYLPIAVTDAGELVFDAKPDSRKIANIRRDGRIAVVVGGADGTTLQAEGVAEVFAAEDLTAGGEASRYATEYLRAFPEYSDSVRGGAVVIVRVRLHWARFGDFRDDQAHVAEVPL